MALSSYAACRRLYSKEDLLEWQEIKREGRAQYKLFWIRNDEDLEGPGILLAEKWINKSIHRQRNR